MWPKGGVYILAIYIQVRDSAFCWSFLAGPGFIGLFDAAEFWLVTRTLVGFHLLPSMRISHSMPFIPRPIKKRYPKKSKITVPIQANEIRRKQLLAKLSKLKQERAQPQRSQEQVVSELVTDTSELVDTVDAWVDVEMGQEPELMQSPTQPWIRMLVYPDLPKNTVRVMAAGTRRSTPIHSEFAIATVQYRSQEENRCWTLARATPPGPRWHFVFHRHAFPRKINSRFWRWRHSPVIHIPSIYVPELGLHPLRPWAHQRKAIPPGKKITQGKKRLTWYELPFGGHSMSLSLPPFPPTVTNTACVQTTHQSNQTTGTQSKISSLLSQGFFRYIRRNVRERERQRRSSPQAAEEVGRRG